MPWQETCVRNEGTRFVVDWERKLESTAELCRRYGVSRRTGYKWLQRYQQQGWAGLEDRSRAPRRHALQRRSSERGQELRGPALKEAHCANRFEQSS